MELALHPLTRLRRLSGRHDDFDQAGETLDLSFLPGGLRAEARALLEAGEISRKALAIMRAEAANYGVYAFDGGAAFSQYHRIEVDDGTPEQVAEAVLAILQRSIEIGS